MVLLLTLNSLTAVRLAVLVALLLCVALFAFDVVSKRAVGIAAIVLLIFLLFDTLRL